MNLPDTFIVLFGCAVLACGALVIGVACLGAVAQRKQSTQNRRTHRLRFWLRIQGVLR